MSTFDDMSLEEWENRNWDNMTYEEAYEYFDTYYPPDGDHIAWRAYELAKEALSKQIPKKPVEGYVFSDGWREHIRKHAPEIADKTGSCCPTCGKHIGNSEQTLKKKNYFPYCHWCGQALLEPEDEK